MVQIVLPMTGLGKRFKEAGYTDPKPLIDVDGKPMIEHVIGLFPGETNVLAICNSVHLVETNLRSELTRICPTAMILSVPYRGKGPVDTVLYVDDFISDDDEVIVSYCDYGTEWDYQRFLEEARSNRADGSIACYRGFHPHHLGPDCYAYVQETDRWASAIQEKKPFTENKLNEFASNGTYYFRTGKLLKEFAWKLVQSGETIRGEFYVSMIYNHMLTAGLKVRVFEIERMLQWGTPLDLQTYQMWHGCFQQLPQLVFQAPGITILPMAGRGSRFAVEGYTIPKPFLPIRGSPMVQAALECLPITEEVRVITLDDHPDVSHYLPSAKIYKLHEVTNGQATTCMTALTDVSDETPITITACDNGALYDATKLQQLMEDPSIDVIVWSFHNHPSSKLYPHMYAWLDVEEGMQLKDVSIKKPFADRPNTHAIIGTMFFRRTSDFKTAYGYCVEHDLRTNGEYYVDNLLKPLVDMGKKVVVFPVDYYLCWGTPNDYKTFTYWQEQFNNDSV
jgi:NDP-sugar pyrophosphorylase family protein